MPRLTPDELAHLMNDDDPMPQTRRNAHARQPRSRPRRAREDVPFRPRTRANERNPFKCGRCRAFVGPAVSGGRHRNHCPICLTSRHVDLRRPGDRASPCRALMPAIGVAFRSNGEQMVVHRCNGCGIERQNRVAADDNAMALLRLPPVIPARGAASAEEEAIA
ncbi:MAG: RNHCP domain-containing protein [Thermomicrobiales bacterium]